MLVTHFSVGRTIQPSFPVNLTVFLSDPTVQWELLWHVLHEFPWKKQLLLSVNKVTSFVDPLHLSFSRTAQSFPSEFLCFGRTVIARSPLLTSNIKHLGAARLWGLLWLPIPTLSPDGSPLKKNSSLEYSCFNGTANVLITWPSM